MSTTKTYFKLNEATHKVEEITLEDYLKCHGNLNTMRVEFGSDRKRKINLDIDGGSISELLAFLSRVR